MFQNSLGIDIKDEWVAFFALRKTFKGVAPVGQAVYTLEKDTPMRKKMSIVNDLAMDFIRENKIGATDIFLGMPAQRAMMREIELPLAVKENLGTTLKYEMDKYVPLPSANISFDYQILSEDKRKGMLKVLLVVLKHEDLQPFLDSELMGLGISGLGPDKTAIANCMDYEAGPISREEISRILFSKEEEHMADLDLTSLGINREKLAPAFGLALQGLIKVPIQINMIPPEKRKKPGKAGFYMMILLTALLIFTGLTWGGSHIVKQRMDAKAQKAELKRLVAEANKFQIIRDKIAEAKESILYLNERQKNRTPISDILRELTVIMPPSAWVATLNISEKGIRLDGYADSASELITLLEASKLFTEANFLSTITKGKDGKERFKIGLKLDS